MEVRSISEYSFNELERLLLPIPFYRAVKELDPYQFDLLMRYSKVISFMPGEVILEKGHVDDWLYFLLKGQLVVHNGVEKAPSNFLNNITPGEVFGDLAGLFNQKRTATVSADPKGKQVTVFGTDFRIFGEPDDLRYVSLDVKLIYYRNMVHNLRWKLEVYRSRYPNEAFSSDHRKVKLFVGEKDTLEELFSLHKQAKALASLLIHWNSKLSSLQMSSSYVASIKTIKATG